jgi:Fur family ferric uptake transcriptional regulator
VYRTLEGLRDAGIVASHEAAGAGATFEWAAGATTHHHLRCVRCGATLEVSLPHLEGLEADIRRQTGFAANLRHLAISGLCEDCRAAGNDSEVAR